MNNAEWAATSALAQWFEGKSLEQIDVLEHEGRALYPETIKRRNPKTRALEVVPVRLRIPNTREKVAARKLALRWAQKQLGDMAPKPLDVEGVQKLLGANYWSHIDNVCLLSLCTFEPAAPHAQFGLPDYLDSFPPASLYELFDRLNYWADQEDPRINESVLTPEAVLVVAKAIAKGGHIGPLHAIDGAAQSTFVRIMAELLTNSPTRKSSSPSPETSTEG